MSYLAFHTREHIRQSPEITRATWSSRHISTWGKSRLADSVWTEVPPGSEVSYNFFKVSVEMK